MIWIIHTSIISAWIVPVPFVVPIMGESVCFTASSIKPWKQILPFINCITTARISKGLNRSRLDVRWPDTLLHRINTVRINNIAACVTQYSTWSIWTPSAFLKQSIMLQQHYQESGVWKAREEKVRRKEKKRGIEKKKGWGREISRRLARRKTEGRNSQTRGVRMNRSL